MQGTIYLIHGFMGFGKTTYAKKLALETGALRLTHDEIMFERYGATPDDFPTQCKLVTEYIWERTAEEVKAGRSVILDFGFWSKKDRQEAFMRAKNLTPQVVFHVLSCPIEVAKKRVLKRTEEDKTALFIDEGCFNDRLKHFEPMRADEGMPMVFYDALGN